MNKIEKELDIWDKFASAVLSGIVSNPESGCNSSSDLAHYAATVADAMMVERNKRKNQLPLI